MSDPYFVALYRAIIAAFIINGSVLGAMIAANASTREIVAAAITGVCATLAVRFLGEGTVDNQRRAQRETALIIQDAANNGFVDDRPVDFNEEYHYSSDNTTRHRGRLASDCPICLREVVT